MEGDILSVSDLIKQAIVESEKQQKEVAAHMGWTPNNFSNRLRNNTVDADEWVEIAKFLGYDIKMVNAKTGEEPKSKERKKGVGGKVVKMVNGVTYDTDKADAICHTSQMAGCFLELYLSAEGAYFIVLYAPWVDDGITMPVEDEAARKFMDACLYTGL